MVRLRDAQDKGNTAELQFQFQYGTIKSSQDGADKLARINFNSSMVRLRAISLSHISIRTTSFQFQYGTIKSIGDYQHNQRKGISIPVWYD